MLETVHTVCKMPTGSQHVLERIIFDSLRLPSYVDSMA